MNDYSNSKVTRHQLRKQLAMFFGELPPARHSGNHGTAGAFGSSRRTAAKPLVRR